MAGCASTATTAPYVSVNVRDAVAPNLPKACGDSHPFDDYLLIFSSRYCTACDTYLRKLARVEADLSRREISVLVCLVDEVTCAQATRDSYEHGSWPVCVADETVQAAWGGVDSQPTTFFVQGGQIRKIVKGRPDIPSLLLELEEVR
jgi:hypothetical protein